MNQARRWITALLLLCLPGLVFGGSIVIRHAELRQHHDGFALRADSDIELNQTIESGLKSGVPLYFTVDFSLYRERAWWWDQRLLDVQRRFSLVYYELTRHYRISALGLEQTRNFRSLLDALDYLGTIRDLPLISEPGHALIGWLPLASDQRFRAELSIALDVDALPLALRPQALVSSAWRLKSKEYHWRVN